MPKELDIVVLESPIPSEGLVRGDVGTVVHVYPGEAAFEVEFTRLDGQTIAVATVDANAVRAITKDDITHTRVR